MRLVAHRPIEYAIRWLVLLVVMTACVMFAYIFGEKSALEKSLEPKSKLEANQSQVVNNIEQQLSQLRTNAEVDRQTIEELRQLVMTQKAQLSASERDLRVYKDLLSPAVKSNPLGISFGVFTILPLKGVGHFSYSLTVQKLSIKDANFGGTLEFRIIGEQSGKSLQLSLYQVSSQVSVPSIPLSFKYFQTLEGDMTLPVDFVPQAVELVVKTSDKKAQPLVSAELDWPLSNAKSK